MSATEWRILHSWRSSAAYRIAFAHFAAYALAIAALGIVIFVVMHIAFSRQLNSMVSDEARSLAQAYRSGGRIALAAEIAEREESAAPTRMLYAVFSHDGRRVMGSLRAQSPPPGLHQINFEDPLEGHDEAQAMALDADGNTRIVVAIDSDWVETFDQVVVMVFGFAFVGTCLLGIGGAVILGGYLKRRLRAISSSAEAITRGEARKRMPVSDRHDEFDQVATTLNRMLDRIDGLLANLRQVSNDIAHDLRTPLTRLRTRLEQSSIEDLGPSEAKAVFGDAVHRVDEILALFAAILRIAEVESGETRRYFAPVDLSGLVADLGESFSPSIEEDDRLLFSAVEPGIEVNADAGLLAQAVINLLENAQLHTPARTVIRLSLVSIDDIASISVVDDGPGIPNSDLPRITKRFARLEHSRNRAGYGLGLSLVRAVAELHHGRLVLDNMHPGLSARIELPILSGSQSSRGEGEAMTSLESAS